MKRKSLKNGSRAERRREVKKPINRLAELIKRSVRGVGCVALLGVATPGYAQMLLPPAVSGPLEHVAQRDADEEASPSDQRKEAASARAAKDESGQPTREDAADTERPSLGGDQKDSTLRDALELLSDPDELKGQQRNDKDSDPISQISSKSLFQGRRIEMSGDRFALPPIAALTTDMTEIGNGEVPEGFRGGESAPLIALPESGVDRGLPWDWNTQYWAAANTFSHPLYFEDRMLERHGHKRFPHLTPLVSGGRFAAQAAILPYLSAIHPPSECLYTLGYYRAGNCVPAFKQRPPYQRKAVAAQATSSALGWTIWP